MTEQRSGLERSAQPPTFDFDGDYGAGYETLARALIPGYLDTFEMALAMLDVSLAENSPRHAATSSSPPRILVVGAGTGIEMVTFKSKRPDWHCTGVDPSAQMIDIARARLVEAGIDDGTSFRHGTVADLPADEMFDAATSFNVMHFIADDGAKASFLGSIADRLEPGAPFILFDLFGEPESSALERDYAAWRAYWTVRGFEGPPRDAFRKKIDNGIEWVGEPRVHELLAGAGFVDVRMFYRGLVYGAWIATRV